MRDGYKFEFGALDEPDAPKVQALKPLEEAAEVYGAWQDCDDMRFSPIMTARREYRQNLIDECMDVVQGGRQPARRRGVHAGGRGRGNRALQREEPREGTFVMETLEQIKADAVEVFHFDRECRPQDRAHAYLGKYRVRRGYNDTAMQVAVTDMIERAYEAGRAEVAGANLVQNLRRQLTSIEATVGDAIDLLDESVGGADCDE